MKERPILFNGQMVRAILEGRKTVTRRLIKDTGCYAIESSVHGVDVVRRELKAMATQCPYGKPGDRLWVRETWADVNLHGGPGIAYRADDDVRDLMEDESFLADGAFNYNDPRCAKYSFAAWSEDLIAGTEGRWRPSIHMPRWASRILLEVTDVRVERLQDITEEQAMAEGIERIAGPHSCEPWRNYAGDRPFSSPVASFSSLWNSTGGDWDANPWVWVVEFKRVEVANV
jgi:hypothetical protein